MVMHPGDHISTDGNGNPTTVNSLKICIVTTMNIYTHPLFKCQIKIRNLLSVQSLDKTIT